MDRIPAMLVPMVMDWNFMKISNFANLCGLTYEEPDIFRAIHFLLVNLAKNLSCRFRVEESHHDPGVLDNITA